MKSTDMMLPIARCKSSKRCRGQRECTRKGRKGIASGSTYARVIRAEGSQHVGARQGLLCSSAGTSVVPHWTDAQGERKQLARPGRWPACGKTAVPVGPGRTFRAGSGGGGGGGGGGPAAPSTVVHGRKACAERRRLRRALREASVRGRTTQSPCRGARWRRCGSAARSPTSAARPRQGGVLQVS